MNIIKPSIRFSEPINGKEILTKLEKCARVCYQSESKNDNSEKFIANIIRKGHESILEHVSITFNVITDRGCYDDQTKVLTDSGWKLFDEVDICKDKICTMDENRNIKYVTAINKIKYKYTGLLDTYKSTQVDLAVTPDHRMWLFDYHKRSPETRTWKFIPSEDVTNKRYMFDKSSTGTGVSQCEMLIIPDVSRQQGCHTRIFKGHVFTGNDVNLFLELIGLWITDGSVSFGTKDDRGITKSGNRISITQIKKGVKGQIIYLANKLGINITEYDNEVRISDPALFDWLIENFIKNNDCRKTYYLSLPRWMFTDLSKYQIDCLLRGIFEGDGSRHSTHKKDGRGFVIYTASRKFAEDLVELALLSGRTANIYITPPRDRTFPNGHTSHCKEQYVVSFPMTTVHLFNNNSDHRSHEYYDGYVYCLELESDHRLFVMRNGKACWCGNCSHEWVRHRIASYSQESTRYVKYDNGNMEFIEPIELIGKKGYDSWKRACMQSEGAYIQMMELGHKAQEARAVLNNSLKTQLVCTMNLRSLRNFLRLRCDKAAHPHIKQLAIPMLLHLQQQIPVVFDDIKYDESFYDSYLSDNRWREYIITPSASLSVNSFELYYAVLDLSEMQPEKMIGVTRQSHSYMNDNITLINMGLPAVGKIYEIRFSNHGYSTLILARTCEDANRIARERLIPIASKCVHPYGDITVPDDIIYEEYKEERYGTTFIGRNEYVCYKASDDDIYTWVYHPNVEKWYALSTIGQFHVPPACSYHRARALAEMNSPNRESHSKPVDDTSDEDKAKPGYYYIGKEKVLIHGPINRMVPYINDRNKKEE